MKKYVINFFKFSFLSFISINLILNTFIQNYPEYFLANNEDYKVMKTMYNLIQLFPEKSNVIIGDSRGNSGLIPTKLSINYINLSLPGSNFMEGYLTLKKRLKLSKIDTLILAYGYNHYESNIWTEKKTISLNFISKKELNDLESCEHKYGQLINENYHKLALELKFNQIERQLKYRHFPMMFYKDFINSFNTLFDPNFSNFDSLVNDSKGHFLFGNQDSFYLPNFVSAKRNFEPGKVNLAYLDSIVLLSKTHNFILKIIIPPVNYSTFEKMKNTNYLKSMTNYFELNLKKYMLNRFNFLPNNCFTDSVHYNQRGSVRFTEVVSILLKKNTIEHFN